MKNSEVSELSLKDYFLRSGRDLNYGTPHKGIVSTYSGENDT